MCHVAQGHRLTSLAFMSEAMTPFERGELLPKLFQIGKAVEVEREVIRSSIGAPFFVETDSSRTFGGEEDWWAYRLPSGEVVALCLAVPYKEVRMLASAANNPCCISALKELLGAWAMEFYERAYAV